MDDYVLLVFFKVNNPKPNRKLGLEHGMINDFIKIKKSDVKKYIDNIYNGKNLKQQAKAYQTVIIDSKYESLIRSWMQEVYYVNGKPDLLKSKFVRKGINPVLNSKGDIAYKKISEANAVFNEKKLKKEFGFNINCQKENRINPVIDATGDSFNNFKKCLMFKTNPDNYELQKSDIDRASISQGEWTIAQTGADYGTVRAFGQDIALTLIGELTGTVIDTTTETGRPELDTIDISSYDLTLRSNWDITGNPNDKISMEHDGYQTGIRLNRISHTTGCVKLCDLYMKWLVEITDDSRFCIEIRNCTGLIVKLHDLNITNFKKSDASSGCRLFLEIDNSIIKCYNMMYWDNLTDIGFWSRDIENGSIFENITICDDPSGFDFDNESNPQVYNCYAKTFSNISNCTGRNNASEDASAADANWGTGSNNKINVNPVDEFQSLDSVNGKEFYLPKSDSVLRGNGRSFSITDHAYYINGILSNSPYTIGAKEYQICFSGINSQENIGIFNLVDLNFLIHFIGIDTLESFNNPKIDLSLKTVGIKSNEYVNDVIVNKGDFNIVTFGIQSEEKLIIPKIKHKINIPSIDPIINFGNLNLYYNIKTNGILTSEIYGNIIVFPGSKSIICNGILSSENFINPTIDLLLNINGIISSENFINPAVDLILNLNGMESNETLINPVINIGSRLISVNGIDSKESISIINIINDKLINVNSIVSSENFGSLNFKFEIRIDGITSKTDFSDSNTINTGNIEIDFYGIKSEEKFSWFHIINNQIINNFTINSDEIISNILVIIEQGVTISGIVSLENIITPNINNRYNNSFISQLEKDIDEVFLSDFEIPIKYIFRNYNHSFETHAIFDNEYSEVDPNTEVGIYSTVPLLYVSTNDFIYKPQRGDKIIINGLIYYVKNCEPDGTGISVLELEAS